MRKEENIISGIYCIENITTHKKYVGQSVNIYDRWSKHKSELNHGKHDNDYLQKAWNKYGEDGFEFSILEKCNQCDLDSREIYYIDLYNTLDRDFGYNLKHGGQDGVISEEAKLKLSQSLKEAYKNQDLIEKRRQDAINQWSDPEIRAKKSGENNGMYGKKHSKEAIEKMKLVRNRKDVSRRRCTHKKVKCIELNQIFKNATEAQRCLSIYSSNILNVCYGKRNTAGGYHWQFVENNI